MTVMVDALGLRRFDQQLKDMNAFEATIGEVIHDASGECGALAALLRFVGVPPAAQK